MLADHVEDAVTDHYSQHFTILVCLDKDSCIHSSQRLRVTSFFVRVRFMNSEMHGRYGNPALTLR
jgi:hypothetical protein